MGLACDAWRLMCISTWPLARVLQEGLRGSASGRLHLAAACTKDSENRSCLGPPAWEGDVLLKQQHNSDQAKIHSLRVFSIFIVGKSHFKDVLFGSKAIFLVNGMQFFTIPSWGITQIPWSPFWWKDRLRFEGRLHRPVKHRPLLYFYKSQLPSCFVISGLDFTIVGEENFQ